MAVIKRKRRSESFNAVAGKQLSPAEIIEKAKLDGVQTEPLDLESLASKLGVRVVTRPMEDQFSGHLSLKNGAWEIVVNSLHHWRRQRFTLAHELGHFFLHRWQCQDFTDTVFFRNDEISPMEAEANQFAAELLMPEEEFKRYLDEVSSKVEDLAEYFGVSALAVRVRAKRLGYQGHGL